MSAPRTLADVALVDLHVRARAVRRLCAETDDLDMRWELVTAAFLAPAPQPVGIVEEPEGQLAIEVAS